MRPTSQTLNHIHEITYEYNQITYTVKPTADGITVTVDDLPLQTRYYALLPKAVHSQKLLQRPIQIYDCLLNQYIAKSILKKQVDKLPKDMISIEQGLTLTLLIKLSYPSAPVRELRYDCSAQEISNPRLQSYQTSLSKMADTAMKEVINRYMPAIRQAFQQYSQLIQKKAQTIFQKIKKRGDEIVDLSILQFGKIMEQAQMEMSKGIKDYKVYLEEQAKGLRKQIQLRSSIILKEVRRKVITFEETLHKLRQNQHQICKMTYDVELHIMEEINCIKGRLDDKATQKVLPNQLKSYILLKMERQYLKDVADADSSGLQRTKSAPKKYKKQKQITGLHPREYD